MELLEQGYGIMPNKVLYDKDLTPNQKLIFVVISGLCAEKGYCRASNSYISKALELGTTTIKEAISVLVKKGYLLSKIDKNDGNKRYLTLGQKIDIPMAKNGHTYGENPTHINIIDKYNIYIASYDDIKEVVDEEYRKYHREGLKCLMKLVEYGYKIEKKDTAIKQFIDWLKDKAEIYGYKMTSGDIAWGTLLQRFDSWLVRHQEKKDVVEKYLTSVLQFIKPKENAMKRDIKRVG